MTYQDRTVKKKSQGGNISPIWGEAPTAPIGTKICMAGKLADVITYTKFQDDIFRGYNFTGGTALSVIGPKFRILCKLIRTAPPDVMERDLGYRFRLIKTNIQLWL